MFVFCISEIIGINEVSVCHSLLNVLNNCVLSHNFSSKYLKTLSKGDVSPFFLDVDGKNPIFRFIYDLLNDGIRGTAKKESILAILADISVSKQTVNYFNRLIQQ